ncbi:hypothetical protein GGI42DRAFT_367409 [Trichoderma sp. SZMC 28013]
MSTAKAKEKKAIKFGAEDLNLAPNDPRYKDGMKCVRTYWAQAAKLETREQEEMIEYLRNHDYYSYVTPTIKYPATSHPLYHETMRTFDAFGLEGLSRPIFLILSSLYDTLPVQYVLMIRDHFGPLGVVDHSQEYLKATSSREGTFTTTTNTSPKPSRTRQALISKPAEATNAIDLLNMDEEDVAFGAGQQVTAFDPVGQVNQSVTLEESKHPRALSDNSAIDSKRTRRVTDKGGFNIDHIVAGVKSSLTIQRFADAAKSASTTAEKPRTANSDLLEMKEDVKIAKEIAMRNEAKIDAVSAKLDGFISEMRQFMTAFANTAGIPLPVVVIDESDSDN